MSSWGTGEATAAVPVGPRGLPGPAGANGAPGVSPPLATIAATITGTDTTQPVHSAGVRAAIVASEARTGAILLESAGVYPTNHLLYDETACWNAFKAAAAQAVSEGKTLRGGGGRYRIKRMLDTDQVAVDLPKCGLVGPGKDMVLEFEPGISSGELWPMPLRPEDSYLPPAEFRDFAVDFQGSSQGTGVRGIVVKTPTAGAGLASYCTSPVFTNIEFFEPRSDMLTFEIGRNLVTLNDIRAYAGGSSTGDGIVVDGSYDCKMMYLDIGSFTLGRGLRLKRGSGAYILFSHLYQSLYNMEIGHEFVDTHAFRVDFDRALRNAIVARGYNKGKFSHSTFYSCTFSLSSSEASGVYSDIKVEGARRMAIYGAHIPYYGGATQTSVTKHFIEFSAYGTNPDASPNDPVPAYIDGPTWDNSIETTIWPSGFTNNRALIRGNWNPAYGVTYPSSTQTAISAGDVNVVVFNSNYWSSSYPLYLSNAPVRLQKTSAGTDEKNSSFSTSSDNGKEVVGIALTNDAENASTLAFGVKRTGISFATLFSQAFPTDWHLAADGDWYTTALGDEPGVLMRRTGMITGPAMAEVRAAGNSTVLTNTGVAAPTATGVATAIASAQTNAATRIRRVEFLETAASTSAVAGWRHSGSQGWSVGDPFRSDMGGFRLRCVWTTATGAAIATHRCFVGQDASTAAPIDINPSTLVNIVGMGWDSGDSNVQIMHNDASGAATKIDLGANFPRPSADRSNAYFLELLALPGTTQTIKWIVYNLQAGIKASGTITTNLPAASVYLHPRGWMSVGGSSSVIGIALGHYTIDSQW